MFRVRLIPMLIVAAALTLSVKVGGIWTDIDVAFDGPSQAVAAEKASADSPNRGGDKKSDTKKATSKDGSKESAEGDGKGDKDKKKSARRPKKPEGFDPFEASEEELRVLQRLADRRAEIDKKAESIAMRESLLLAAEKRIDKKIGQLKRLKATVEALLKRHDKEQEKKLKSVVKIYESMKPKEAARIFQQLDMDVLLDVVERMREAKAAPIIAKMDPNKAQKVTLALAERRALPKTAAAAKADGAEGAAPQATN